MGRRWHPGRVTRRAWLAMGVHAALWGASYMFIKVALDDVSEGFIVFTRIALGAARPRADGDARRRAGAAARALGLDRRGRGDPDHRAVPAHHLRRERDLFVDGWHPRRHRRRSSPRCWPSHFDHKERTAAGGWPGSCVGILGVALLFGVDLSTGWAARDGRPMVLLASFGYGAGAMLIKNRLKVVRRSASPRRTWPSPLLTLPLADRPADRRGRGHDRLDARPRRGRYRRRLPVFYTLIVELGPSRARSSPTWPRPSRSSTARAARRGGHRGGRRPAVDPRGIVAGAERRALADAPASRSAPSRSSAPDPVRAR